MVLKDVAIDINMDISTISRVTNGKYVQMPWGIRELKNWRIGELVDVAGKVDLWFPAIEPPGGHFFRKLEKRGIGERGIGELGNRGI